jgi:AraC-binding-like domain
VTSLPSMTRHGKDALPSDYGKLAGLLTTASVPAAQRLEFWREVVCHTIAGVEADALADEHPYSGAIHAQPIPLAHMPSFDLVHVEADPQRVNRTRELISVQTEATWLLMVQEEGTCTIRQGKQQATLKPGDIGFLDTGRPYEVIFPQTFRQNILRMPTALFDDIMPKGRDVAGMALSGDDALTAIARQNIVLLERFVSAIDPILLPAAANRALDHIAHPRPILRVRAVIYRRRWGIRFYLSNKLQRPSGSPAGISSKSFGKVRARRSVNTFASGAWPAAAATSPMPASFTKALPRSHSAGAFRNRAALAAPFVMPFR